MTVVFLLAGAGLWLLPPAHPARRRLVGLVGGRLPVPAVVADPGRRFSFRIKAIAAVAMAGGLTLLLVGPVPGLLAAAVVATVSWVWHALLVERDAASDEVRLVALAASLVAEQAAGAGSASALRQAAPEAGRWQPALLRAAAAAGNGGEPAAGLAREPLLIPFAVALAVAGRTGAGLTDVLARVRSELLARQECRRAVEQAVAGPRSSAVLLSLLPLVGLAMGAALGARPWHVLTATPAGLIALVAGVLLELTGLVWTIQLTR